MTSPRPADKQGEAPGEVTTVYETHKERNIPLGDNDAYLLHPKQAPMYT